MIVELLTGLYFALYTAVRGVSLDTVLALAFAAVLVAAFFIDLEHYIIPDELNLAGLAVGVVRDTWKLAVHDPNWGLASVWLPALGWAHVPRSLVTAAGAALALYMVAVLGTWLFRREAMGMGDVKLAAAIGANLTAAAALTGFFIAVLVGALVGVALILLRLRGRRDLLPFGPFLALGTLVAMVWGERLFAWYAGLTGLG